MRHAYGLNSRGEVMDDIAAGPGGAGLKGCIDPPAARIWCWPGASPPMAGAGTVASHRRARL
ncbi:hypothetical protein JMM63_15235 [Rhodovulum sulfidophilum]|uniref:hypothetical protein n=1 Tax=Rhodovulum sulfidophilum TaxID=35806 RepID=UPI001922A9FE|nr:hypothetical protein [Rhodovulum sulfidophilum]MBL3596902.1 hypothetical protein [Rhodovulum sulfidophilum]